MTGSDTVRAFSSAMLALIPFGTVLERKLQSRLGDGDRKWRDRQAARLESLKQRMKAEEDFAVMRYSDLPNVRLAGLLAAPRDEHPRCDQEPEFLSDSASGVEGCAQNPAVRRDLQTSQY